MGDTGIRFIRLTAAFILAGGHLFASGNGVESLLEPLDQIFQNVRISQRGFYTLLESAGPGVFSLPKFRRELAKALEGRLEWFNDSSLRNACRNLPEKARCLYLLEKARIAFHERAVDLAALQYDLHLWRRFGDLPRIVRTPETGDRLVMERGEGYGPEQLSRLRKATEAYHSLDPSAWAGSAYSFRILLFLKGSEGEAVRATFPPYESLESEGLDWRVDPEQQFFHLALSGKSEPCRKGSATSLVCVRDLVENMGMRLDVCKLAHLLTRTPLDDLSVDLPPDTLRAYARLPTLQDGTFRRKDLRKLAERLERFQLRDNRLVMQSRSKISFDTDVKCHVGVKIEPSERMAFSRLHAEMIREMVDNADGKPVPAFRQSLAYRFDEGEIHLSLKGFWKMAGVLPKAGTPDLQDARYGILLETTEGVFGQVFLVQEGRLHPLNDELINVAAMKHTLLPTDLSPLDRATYESLLLRVEWDLAAAAAKSIRS